MRDENSMRISKDHNRIIFPLRPTKSKANLNPVFSTDISPLLHLNNCSQSCAQMLSLWFFSFFAENRRSWFDVSASLSVLIL